MLLPNPPRPLINPPIHRRRHRQRAPHNRTHARQKPGQTLGPRLPIDDLHRTNVIRNEYPRDPSPGVQSLFVAF